jgi:NADH-quinone oxidoreductase subunit L
MRVIASGVSVLSVVLAWLLYAPQRPLTARFTASRLGQRLARAAEVGFGFDWAYDRLIVRPFVAIARLNKQDFVDRIFDVLAGITAFGNRALSYAQNGNLRWYAAGIAAGAVIVIAIMVLL